VVTVKVGDEDMVEAGKFQFGTAELELRSFTAVNHEQFLAYVYHLRRCEMSGGRQSGTAT
jgi:hypothetical protein